MVWGSQGEVGTSRTCCTSGAGETSIGDVIRRGSPLATMAFASGILRDHKHGWAVFFFYYFTSRFSERDVISVGSREFPCLMIFQYPILPHTSVKETWFFRMKTPKYLSLASIEVRKPTSTEHLDGTSIFTDGASRSISLSLQTDISLLLVISTQDAHWPLSLHNIINWQSHLDHFLIRYNINKNPNTNMFYILENRFCYQ